MTMKHIAACAAFVVLAVCASPRVAAGAGEDERARNAVRVLDEIMQAPDKRVPDALLARAEAIAVIPDVVKAGFVVGGRRGKGMLAVRGADGTWTNASFVTL